MQNCLGFTKMYTIITLGVFEAEKLQKYQVAKDLQDTLYHNTIQVQYSSFQSKTVQYSASLFNRCALQYISIQLGCSTVHSSKMKVQFSAFKYNEGAVQCNAVI